MMTKVTLSIAAALWLCHSTAPAGEYVLDDFVDMDATDGDPVRWSPGGAAIGRREVTQEGFVHTPIGGKNMSTYVTDFQFEDVSLRTQLRLLGDRSQYITLFARSRTAATVYGGLEPGNIVLAKSIGQDVIFLQRQPTDLDPSLMDIMLQFDVVGDELALTAWEAGAEKPTAPQIRAEIGEYPLDSGYVGFFYNPGGTSNPVVFRSFEAVPIPEPSSMLLAGIGLFGAGLFTCRQRRSVAA